MSEQTKIAWCDSTVNFWSGCTKVSPGCAHCYAETRDKRHMIEAVDHWGKNAPRLKHTGAVKQARAFNRKPWICDVCGEAFAEPDGVLDANKGCLHIDGFHRRRIFSLSLGDWLDPEVPIAWLAEMLDTIRECDQVQWILCTKRPELWSERLHAAMRAIHNETDIWISGWLDGIAPKQICLLTSIEDQSAANERIPALLKIPAAVRGLSLEPLLGPVDLMPWLGDHDDRPNNWGTLDWLILGGESGPGARVCNLDWIADLLRQGTAAGVATFVKQLGANPFCENANRFDWSEDVELQAAGTAFAACRPLFADPKGGDPAEWPEELRVRQFPEV